MTRVQLALTAVDPLSPTEAVTTICDAAEAGRGYVVVTPNLAHLSLLSRDPDYRAVYATADLSLPDGWPVVAMARVHGAADAVRVAGSELVEPLCEEAARRGLSVGFVGGAGDAARAAAEVLQQRFPELRVAVTDPAPPGFDADDEALDAWIDALPEPWADVLFIGLGEPRQGRLAFRLREDPRARVLIGVGKALEFTAGTAERAPAWYVEHRLEWLHRALTEPRRLGPRYLQGLRDLPGMYWRERRAARR
jgi:N-acetylglucosaminyldiphosphoundecaprenol N-acetyl-beta-D-mannosaminyltransferase